MLFARLRRSVALFICPELDAQKRLKAIFARLEDSSVIERLSKESYLRIKAGYPFLNQNNAMVAFGVQNIPEPKQSILDCLDAGIIACEQDRRHGNPNVNHRAEVSRDAVFEAVVSHVSSPVGVGASQGREASGPVKAESGPGRKLDDSLAGDLIGVVFLFGLIPLILSIGGM